MGAIVNGLTLYGSFRAYGATFLIFSDYMRAAVRLACLMNIPSIFVYTHDSVFLGEDGPTHQPIEHLWSLRLIPNMTLWRPGDGRGDRDGVGVGGEEQRRAATAGLHAPEARHRFRAARDSIRT